eukprot:2572605-Prymnesium_polylepis.1
MRGRLWNFSTNRYTLWEHEPGDYHSPPTTHDTSLTTTSPSRARPRRARRQGQGQGVQPQPHYLRTAVAGTR